MHAIQVATPGDASVLESVEIPKPSPRAGEVLVRIQATGVNYIDVYHRSGLYEMPLPFIPGSEAAGVVEDTGQRVAWAMAPGAYAEYAAVPREKLVPLPDSIDARTAAASMLQGMTAHYLVTSVFPLGPGHTALVHAAAGGVGGLLVQWAKRLGARVIATASTKKLDDVRALGADEVIDYTATSFVHEVLRLTGGRGVDVAYDSVGRTTFDGNLEVLALRGTLALFGQSSGTVPPFDPARLAKKAAFLTRPSLGHYTTTREELLGRAGALFDAIAGGLRVRVDRALPLREAAEAHRLLEGRQTSGKLLLIP